jgi:hypothetical protein
MTNQSDAERWRAHAADALAAAARMTDPEARRGVCEIAIGYWLLAQRADRREALAASEPLPRTSYDPRSLTVICRAFGDAWVTIAAQIGDEPSDVLQAAQSDLANILLSLAGEEASDADALREAALQAFALRHA